MLNTKKAVLAIEHHKHYHQLTMVEDVSCFTSLTSQIVGVLLRILHLRIELGKIWNLS